MRKDIDDRAPLFATVGGLAGALLALIVFGVLGAQPWLSVPWGDFIFSLYVAPVIPAVTTFVACTCGHAAPRGWPFVRGGAAAAAYLTFVWAGLGGYGLLGPYSAYARVEDLVVWVFGPVALMALATFGVASVAHRRVLRESALADVPSRRSLLEKVTVYHVLAGAFGALSIPQAVELGSRSGPYILFILPIPMFLFVLGSSSWFWAAVTRDPERVKGDIIAALLLQSLPLGIMGPFAVFVLLDHVLPGTYTWRDPYYQNIITDPTLAISPFLGFATFAVLTYILVTEWRGPASAEGAPAAEA